MCESSLREQRREKIDKGASPHVFLRCMDWEGQKKLKTDSSQRRQREEGNVAATSLKDHGGMVQGKAAQRPQSVNS